MLSLFLLAGLTGCQVELYSGLEEKEGNDILAVLLSHDIPATKVLGKDNIVSILIDEADVAAAIELLRHNGFPRDQFVNLGDVFQKQGLISSPLEERVRYIYGLSQSMSETLSQIDGVLTARVHIVLPKKQPLEDFAPPSSASVFIKYRPGMGIEEMVPNIKMIMQNSIEGLSYDKIAVALFPAQEASVTKIEGPPLNSVMGLRIARDSLGQFVMMGVVFGTLLLLAVLGNAYLLWRMRRGKGSGKELVGGG
jgi:type III secretion protein J